MRQSLEPPRSNLRSLHDKHFTGLEFGNLLGNIAREDKQQNSHALSMAASKQICMASAAVACICQEPPIPSTAMATQHLDSAAEDWAAATSSLKQQRRFTTPC